MILAVQTAKIRSAWRSLLVVMGMGLVACAPLPFNAPAKPVPFALTGQYASTCAVLLNQLQNAAGSLAPAMPGWGHYTLETTTMKGFTATSKSAAASLFVVKATCTPATARSLLTLEGTGLSAPDAENSLRLWFRAIKLK